MAIKTELEIESGEEATSINLCCGGGDSCSSGVHLVPQCVKLYCEKDCLVVTARVARASACTLCSLDTCVRFTLRKAEVQVAEAQGLGGGDQRLGVGGGVVDAIVPSLVGVALVVAVAVAVVVAVVVS